jgi:hypothetical protein
LQNYKFIMLDKKTRCTECKKKLLDGTQVVCYKQGNKIKAYLCCEKCVTQYKYRKENLE